MDNYEKQVEQIEENLHKWFKEKWVRFGPDGEIRGKCAREKSSEGKPKCRPLKSAQAMGKDARATAARRKRREDPNPDRKGKAKNVRTENKIVLSMDPNWYGAEVGDYKATGPTIDIPTNKTVGFEPDEKMQSSKSKPNVEKIIKALESGDKLPPILVRKYKDGYQVIDGHHRFWAYKLLKKDKIPAQVVPDEDIEIKKGNITESSNLSIEQLATISDKALHQKYKYVLSEPGNTFGWQANIMSATYAKKAIDMGVTDIEEIANEVHKGWNVTAKKFVENPDQFDDTEKLRQSGTLNSKIQQRSKLMNLEYDQLNDDEKEKDRVVARALLDAIKGKQDIVEEKCPCCGDPIYEEDELDENLMYETILDERKKKKKRKAKKKKDACYYKVKARYKVWPSAYASGALVKCRKKGSKNWGTKSEGVVQLDEKWSEKYKRSIDCSHPKGFSQKAHCQGRKKNEETLMKEDQLKNLIREMVEEMYKEQTQLQDECWECYEAAMQEGTDEIYEECYRKTNWNMVPEGEEHTCDGDSFYEVYGDQMYEADVIQEAEYRGRKVKLGKPMRGDVKKFKVYVRKPNGKVVKVNFGDKKMRIKKSNPKRRKSFRARHNCKNPGPRWKARYWSCRAW